MKIVIEELHKAFEYLNRDCFEGKLPLPAITVQSRGKNQKTLGWCSVNKIWKDNGNNDEKYEITIVAEALNRGLVPVMATLMHEMVHLHNLENDIKDTSRGLTYHNKKFKEECEKRGLEVEQGKKVGWGITKCSPQLVKQIYSYNLCEEAFGFGRLDVYGGEKEKKKKGKSSTRRYKCPECGNIIRATKEVNVICGDCNVAFELVPDDYIITAKFRCKDCGQELEQPLGTTTCVFCGGELEQIVEEEPQAEIRSFINPIEICCKGCGTITKVEKLEGEGVYICPECGSLDVFDITNPNVDLNSSAPIDEVDDKLIDENGELVDVKQKVLPIAEPVEEAPAETAEEPVVVEYSDKRNTGWDEERIKALIAETANILSQEGCVLPVEEIPVEIKNMKNLGKAVLKEEKTRGRGKNKLVTKKFEFSKVHIEEDCDCDIADTIKHEVVHAWLALLKGVDQKHNDLFKRYAVKVGALPKATKVLHKIKNVWGDKYLKRASAK